MPKSSLISIVEDDQPFRESMRKLMGVLGYTVEAFPSAGSFLAWPLFANTACLVADVHMPDMTGVDLYKVLTKAGHSIPTILVTAYPDASVRQHMLAMGVHCYLPKPLEEAVLIDCLRSAVGRGGMS